jgi:hypothetical protein
VLYKCTRCGLRRRCRVWPRSHVLAAHCPRCYSQDLQTWNRAFVASTLWRSIVFALGGLAYRCYECHHVFVSLRPRRLFFHHKASPVHLTEEETADTTSSSSVRTAPVEERPKRREYSA